MIVTTELGLRYRIEEVASGAFRIWTIDHDGWVPNPWTGTSVRVVGEAPILRSLSLKIGEPLAFDTSTGQQVTPDELRARGGEPHNRITAIEP